MIRVGKYYTSKSGERFFILAKKNRASSNGCNYIGENTKTGLVTFFNQMGKHAVSPDWQLEVDQYKWVGIRMGNMLSHESFVSKDELEEEYPLYLRIESDDPSTITCITRAGFENTYA